MKTLLAIAAALALATSAAAGPVSNYPDASTPYQSADSLLGSDASNGNATSSFPLGTLSNYVLGNLTGPNVTGALGYTPLNPSNNLSDLGSASTARTNLGVPLGTSGSTLCLLSSTCTWGGTQTFNSTTVNNILGGLSPVPAAAKGVKCDGSTNDTSAIQTLLTAGGAIALPPGTCLFTTLSITKPVRLIGAVDSAGSPATVLQSTDATSTDKIVVGNGSTGIDGVLFEHLVINAPSAATGASLLFFNGSVAGTGTYLSQLGLSDVKVLYPGNASYDLKATGINGLRLSDVTLYNASAAAIYNYGTNNSRSDNIYVFRLTVAGNGTGTGNGNCVDLDGFVNGLEGEHLFCEATGRGIYTHNTQGATVRAEFINLFDFVSENTQNECIRNDFHDSIHIYQMYCEGTKNSDGVVINYNATSGTSSTNIEFIGGEVINNWNRGLYLNGDHIRVIGLNVAGNGLSTYNGGSPVATLPGIELGANSANVLLSANHSAVWTNVSSPTQTFGVKVDSGATNYSICGNDFTGNATGPVSDAAGGSDLSAGSYCGSSNLGGVTDRSVYALAPTSGQTITVGPSGYNIQNFVLQPSGTLASLTFALPANALPGQRLSVWSNQAITALTFTPAGGDTVSQAPASLAAGAGFVLQYSSANHLWIRVQ